METITNLEVQRRLIASGDWPKAMEERKAEVSRFLAEGLELGEAAKRSWDFLRERYADVFARDVGEAAGVVESQPGSKSRKQAVRAEASGGGDAVEEGTAAEMAVPPADDRLPWVVQGDPDFPQDVRWVYENYRLVVRTTPRGPVFEWAKASRPAPSQAALGLMEWAAENRTKFFSDVAPKVFRADDGDDEREDVAENRRSMAEIRASIAKVNEAVAKALARAAKEGG